MTDNPTEICLMVQFFDQEAWDLAQFLKRVGFAEFRSNAVDDDAAYRMQAAVEKIRRSLVAIGYAPR
jgi:hypothetical protein